MVLYFRCFTVFYHIVFCEFSEFIFKKLRDQYLEVLIHNVIVKKNLCFVVKLDTIGKH